MEQHPWFFADGGGLPENTARHGTNWGFWMEITREEKLTLMKRVLLEWEQYPKSPTASLATLVSATCRVLKGIGLREQAETLFGTIYGKHSGKPTAEKYKPNIREIYEKIERGDL